MSSGSSPLSRGILLRTQEQHGVAGIIPALAGNTARLVLPRSGPPDHPRSRGEYTEAARQVGADTGSSPLSRGILNSSLIREVVFRIIPALAGNTH